MQTSPTVRPFKKQDMTIVKRAEEYSAQLRQQGLQRKGKAISKPKRYWFLSLIAGLLH